jgi:hypothetical protein
MAGMSCRRPKGGELGLGRPVLRGSSRQRAIDLRSLLGAIMRGHPSLSRYSSFYVKPEDVADLSPEEAN